LAGTRDSQERQFAAVKAEALGLIEYIGDESSIPVLTREFGY